MGCVVGIHAWHPSEKWSPLWKGEADPKILAEHQIMDQYHIFRSVPTERKQALFFIFIFYFLFLFLF